MRIVLATLLALALPATASASTLHTDAGHVYFDGGANDRVNMMVNAGFDAELGNTAAFFVAFAGHVDPTTADPNCRVAKCLLANREVDVTAGAQDDFVRVASGGSQVVFKGGGGNDRVFVDNGTRLNAFGEAGSDDLMGGTGIDALDGGPGDDTLTPVGPFDDVHGGADFDTVRMPGGGVTVSLDDAANDGPAGQTSENIHSDVEKVAGGSGNDAIDGSAGPNTLDGGDGNDTLNGLGGADTLIGGGGNDVIQARDGVADTVSCGTGDDRAVVDLADQVSPDCETVERPDPVVTATPTPTATPTAAPTPVPETRPAAPVAVPYHVRHRWDLAMKWSRLVELTIDRVPAGTKLTVTCIGRGCAFKSRAASAGNLAKLFKRRKLSKGAVIDVKISAPGYKDVTVRFTVKDRKRVPQQREL